MPGAPGWDEEKSRWDEAFQKENVFCRLLEGFELEETLKLI